MKTDKEVLAKLEEYINKKDECWTIIRNYSKGSPEYERAQNSRNDISCIISALQWVRGIGGV